MPRKGSKKSLQVRAHELANSRRAGLRRGIQSLFDVTRSFNFDVTYNPNPSVSYCFLQRCIELGWVRGVQLALWTTRPIDFTLHHRGRTIIDSALAVTGSNGRAIRALLLARLDRRLPSDTVNTDDRARLHQATESGPSPPAKRLRAESHSASNRRTRSSGSLSSVELWRGDGGHSAISNDEANEMHDLLFVDACDGRDVGTPEPVRMPSLPLYSLDDPDPCYSEADILPAHAVPGTKRRRDDKDGSAGEQAQLAQVFSEERAALKKALEKQLVQQAQVFAEERAALKKALEEQLAQQAQAFSEERAALKKALEEQQTQLVQANAQHAEEMAACAAAATATQAAADRERERLLAQLAEAAADAKQAEDKAAAAIASLEQRVEQAEKRRLREREQGFCSSTRIARR
eukprot:gene12649-biopygen9078